MFNPQDENGKVAGPFELISEMTTSAGPDMIKDLVNLYSSSNSSRVRA